MGDSRRHHKQSEADNLLRWTNERANEALGSVLSGPVAPTPDIDGLRTWLAGLTMEESADPKQIITQTLEWFCAGSVHSTHPGYFGLFNPAPVIWGEIADLISARFNPQLAVWSHAPAAVEMEQHAIRLMLDRIGFDLGVGFFTTGGEEANRCGVLTALARRWPEYPEAGMASLARWPVFYTSSESHLAWLKIAAMVGLGRNAVRLVPVGGDLRMDICALKAMTVDDRRAGREPFLVAATAGTTAAGIIDPLPELATFAARENMALHVDAAWAGAAVLSDRWRPALEGISSADSVTIDAHKWLSQPMGIGMFFTRHPAALDTAFGVSASYMPKAVEGRLDYYRVTPAWSRRWLGLRLFLTLAIAGRRGVEAQIDRDVALGQELRALLEASGWRIVNKTPLPVVCFTREGREGDARWHEVVAQRVIESGRAWISTVDLDGRPALRACITNWRSEQQHIESLVSALNAAAAEA